MLTKRNFTNLAAKVFFVVLFLGTCILLAATNDDLDLDFEQATLAGWMVGGEGFAVHLDSSTAAGGEQSLRFTFKNEVLDIQEGPFAYAVARLSAEPFRGKRIRLSGALKTRDAAAYVSLGLRAEAGLDPTAFKMMPGKETPKGSSDWKRYSIEMDVPRNSDTIYLGAVVYGSKGTAWVDELKVEVLSPGPRFIVVGGTVKDKDGKPVQKALVTVKTFYRETPLACTESDRSGTFAFQLAPAGYMLSATAPGLTAASLPFRQFDKDVRDLVLTLEGQGFTIKGKVSVVSGKIPSGSYVVANKLDFFGGDMFCIRPQKDGSFQVTVPTGVPYMVHLDSPTLQANRVMVDPGSKHTCTIDAFVPQAAPGEVVSWVKQHALPLRTAEPGSGFADLQPLKGLIGAARVVALGETSHGTREIFQMKHRLLEFLVEEMGFNVFAMESLWPESLAVNDYVLHGRGDPARAVAGLYGVWDTEEVIALVEWMRAYNADPAHKRKVKFFGIDIQGSTVAADLVSRYLEKVDPLFAEKKETAGALSLLKKRSVFYEISRYSARQSLSLKASIAGLLLRFDRQKDNYTAKSSYQDWLKNRQLVRYLQQFVDYAAAGRRSDYRAIDIRDRSMADNIRWILDHEAPGTRIVYWAHNYHVALAPYPAFPARPMGRYLQQVLGSDYLSIGFEFNRGSFQSRDSTPSQTPFLMKSFTLDPIPGSFAAAMSLTEVPIFLLDLRSVPGEGAVHDWFAAPQVFKSIDSVYASQKDIQHLFRVPRYFDAVIFFEHTTRARPNPKSPIPRFLR